MGVLPFSALDRLRNLDHSCVPVLLYYDPPYPCQRPTSAQIATVCQASIVSDNIDDRRVFLDRHRITHPAARHTHREDYILVPDDHSPNTTDSYDTTWIGVTLSDVPFGIYPTYQYDLYPATVPTIFFRSIDNEILNILPNYSYRL